MLSNMWSKTENLASCVMSVETDQGWVDVFTLEELLNDKVAWHAWNLVEVRDKDREASLREAYELSQ